MGNCCSGSTRTPRTVKQGDAFEASTILVGDAERFGKNVRKFDAQEVKPERRAMSALEMLAELETIYRRNPQEFESVGGLDFTNADQYFLRQVLDEPVGRFYLQEFCIKKDAFNDTLPFLKLWVKIHLLHYKEVTLQDVERLREAQLAAKELKDKSKEDKRKTPLFPSIKNSFGTLSRRITGKVTVEHLDGEEAPEVEAEEVDEEILKSERDFKERRSRYNNRTVFTTSVMDDEAYARLAEECVLTASGLRARERDSDFILTQTDQLLHDLGGIDFATIEDEAVREELAEAREEATEKAKQQLESEDDLALSLDTFSDVQACLFKVMLSFGLQTKFKEHSEYIRYRKKYKVVYNFVRHNDFDYMQTLGKGSFGRVIRVRKKTNRQQQYALKVMSKKRILSGAEIREQATIEKEVLVRCFASPFVVGLHYAFQTSRALFIALDLLEGGTLSDMMKKCEGKRVPIDVVRVVAMQIILGLNHLHLHGILYRDLKPGNILLDANGNAVLTDMGLCAKYKVCLFDPSFDEATAEEHEERVSEELVLPLHHEYIAKDAIADYYRNLSKGRRMPVLKRKSLKCVGTPSYRAPEVLAITSSTEMKRKRKKKNFKPNRSGYGHEADYWALGVTLYYLTKGQHPFRNKSPVNHILGPSPDHRKNEQAEQKYVPAFDKEFSNNPSFASLLKGLLTRDPAQRLGHDIKELQRHPFFCYDFDSQQELQSWDDSGTRELWLAVLRKELKPLYLPPQKNRAEDEKPRFKDLGEAMRQFAQENVLELFGGGEHDIVEDFRRIKGEQQAFFEEWNYIPEQLLEEDWDRFDEYFSIEKSNRTTG